MATSHYSADSARNPLLLLLSAVANATLPLEARVERVQRSSFPRAGSSELCVKASNTVIIQLG